MYCLFLLMFALQIWVGEGGITASIERDALHKILTYFRNLKGFINKNMILHLFHCLPVKTLRIDFVL